MFTNETFSYVNLNRYRATQGDDGARYLVLKEQKNIPLEIIDFRNNLITTNNLQDWFIDPFLPDFIIYIQDEIKTHTHTSLKGFKHIRYNIYLQLAESGGFYQIEEKIVEPKINEIYFLEAEKDHAITKINSGEAIIISFGFCKEETKNV